MLPPIKTVEAVAEAELEDLSIILLSPKKLPKLEHLDHKSSELHKELPAERDKEPVPVTSCSAVTSLEDLSCSITEMIEN